MTAPSPPSPEIVDLVGAARAFAIEAHRRVGQLRKYSGQPYEEHLRRVAMIVGEVTEDPETIAAAWLHDVVEDTPVTIEEVERTFGPGVRTLVDALTDVSRPHHGNRAARKALDRDHLAKAPPRAQTVKLADLIDNCNDICKHSPRFGPVFAGEMEGLLAVLTEGDAALRRRARKTLDRWVGRLGRVERVSALPLIGAPQSAPSGPDLPTTARVLVRAFRAADLAVPLPDAARDAKVAPSQRLAGHVGLADVVLALTRHDYCVVSLDNGKSGYLSRAEMQGPLARMWLFGIITTFELAMTEGIRWLGDSLDWKSLLTPGRLAKAQALQAERALLGRSVPLLDCLQLSDKVRIVLALDDEPRPLLRGGSKAESQRLARDLENLRNSLAHAQDIVAHDWAQVARVARRIEELAAG